MLTKHANKSKKRRALITGAGAAAGLTYLPAFAQEKFPSKPIEVVTHSGAGGGTDITARMMMVHAPGVFGTELVVANRVGGAGAAAPHCLAILFNEFLYPGVDRHITITQEEIGHLPGFPGSTSTRHYMCRGLLDIEYRGVTVRDLKGLRSFGQQLHQ